LLPKPPDLSWPIPARDWFAVLAAIGVEEGEYKGAQWTPTAFAKLVAKDISYNNNVGYRRLGNIIALLERGMPADARLRAIHDIALAEVHEARRLMLDLVASFGPLSSWNRNHPLLSGMEGFSQADIDDMLARIRTRIDQRLACTLANDALGRLHLCDPIMLARSRDAGRDDLAEAKERLRRFPCTATLAEVTDFHLQGITRKDGGQLNRLTVHVMVSTRYDDQVDRGHQIWVQCDDGEWYCRMYP
jgi:hypothetical protein